MKIKHDIQGPRIVHECTECKTPYPSSYANTPLAIGSLVMIDGSVMWKIWKGPYLVAEGIKSEAEAAFIVRAVNAHCDLLKTCKKAYAMGNTLMDEVVGKKATDWETVNEAMCALVEAIAKAEGKL